MISGVSAILLISPSASKLADFYRDAIGLPLEDEVHEGIPLHYGCEMGPVHFAIHPSESWPGEIHKEPLSPVIVLETSDVRAAHQRLLDAGIAASPPYDHGFGILTSFRDPDGNNVQLMELPKTE
ncbi:MAG: VOC family protein [Pseudomonadales bacterium]